MQNDRRIYKKLSEEITASFDNEWRFGITNKRHTIILNPAEVWELIRFLDDNLTKGVSYGWLHADAEQALTEEV